MEKFNLSYKTHLFRILAIFCLLSSYLWIAPSQVQASSAGFQAYSVLGSEEQIYNRQMVRYGPWKDGYGAGLLNPVQLDGDDINSLTAPTAVLASAKEQTQPQTFGLSLEEYLWPTEPLQTDNLSLSISKGDVPQAPGESNPSAPLQQVTTLEVEIISSPWATLDHNGEAEPEAGGLPGVFVVEAVVTNTGSTTATGLEITLDYDEDPSSGWILLAGENPVRTLGELASGASHYAYWLARYPHDIDDYSPLVTTHQYTVTADAANASSVATAENFYEPDPSWTVQTRETQGTGNSAIAQGSAEVIVGVALTLTQVYTWGQELDDIAFSPVGNVDFDPTAYRLIASEVGFYDEDDPPQGPTIVTDRLYFDTVPSWSDYAEVTYTFLALLPENATLCPYATLNRIPNPKYDKFFCSDETKVVITGTLTLSQTKQVNSLTIEQGQLLTYTINYTNTGDRPLQYAWIWDDISATLASVVAGSITPAPAIATDSRVGWNLGTIPASGQSGSTGTHTFAILVDGDGQDLADNTSLVNHAFFGVNIGDLPTRSALTSTVTTTIHAPTIALSKTDGREIAQPESLLTYTLRITNSGSIATSSLVITDELPADVTLAGATTPAFDSQDGQTLVWDSQNIPASDDLVVTIPVVVNSGVPDGTTLVNTATVMYRNASGQHTFATQTATDTTIIQSPVLTITKTARDVDGPPLVVSDTVRYTLQVTNTGTYTASNVTVTDDLPDQVTCQAVSGDSPPAGGCADPLVWDIPSLAPDDTASLYIDVIINSGSEGQTIINTASVTGENVPDPPPDTPPVCPDGSAPVGGVCPTPDPLDTELAFTKTAEDLDGGYLVVGDDVRYTLQVTNVGTYTAYDVTVTDDLPDQVTCQAVSGDSPPAGCADPLVWSISSLAIGATASLYIDVTINLGSEGQTITNTGSVTGTNVPDPPDDPPPVCPDGSTPVGGVCPNTPVATTTLALTKTAKDVDGSPLVVGDEILYTLQVTNTGDHTAYNVTVTDDLPNQVTCQEVSGDSPPAGCADPLVWDIPSLAADATASLYITVTINDGSEGQSIINTGSVTGENVPDPPDDPTVCPDGSTPVGGVCPTPDPRDTELAFTKTARDVDGGYLVVGDEILYTLQVTNIGTYTAYDVTVTDDLPDQVTCQAVSGDSAPAGCADPLVWSIPSLAVDATAFLYVTVTINPGSEGQSIINTGSVTGTNVPDPPDDPTVCPDGSTPVGGVCPNTPVATTTLDLTKTAKDVDGGELLVGDEILYTLQVTNTGTSTAYNVTVTDDLPNQVTCQEVSGDSAPAGCADPLVWDIPSLAAGGTASLYITVTINEGSEGQSFTNTASVTGENVPNPPPNPPPVCPDGSLPVNGVCPTPVTPTRGGIYLPIIRKS